MNREIIQQIVGKMQELVESSIEKGIKEGHIGDLNVYFNKGLNRIGLELLKEVYESIDEAIYRENKKDHIYSVVKKDEKSLLTSLGEVKFTKRLYKDLRGKSKYLFDEHLKIRKGTRITVDAVSRVIDETIDTSYRKGGLNASISDSITKQTVKNILKTTEVPKVSYKIPKKKKQVEYLYIDADEDHIALQREYELNAINKLIYVYEGIESVAPRSERNRLINPHYFARVTIGKGDNTRFWQEVRKYIDDVYDIKSIKRIYLNGDGALWIKEALNVFSNITFVMDKFHVTEYIHRMTKHLDKYQDEAKEEIYKIIHKRDRDAYDRFIGKLYATSKNSTTEKNIIDGDVYFRNNFDSICLRFSKDEHIVGCSAEGHISHVLASRMSSRPMGWTIKGANKITALRLYKLNGGDIYTLVKANDIAKQSHTFTSNQEDDDRVYSAQYVITDEKNKNHEELKYIEHYKAELTVQGKKALLANNIRF